MNDGKVGLLTAIWRFISFYKLRKALAISRAADRQFTETPQGISDAFTLHGENLRQRYTALRTAVAKVQQVIETDSARLKEQNEEESKLLAMREGALAKFEAATTPEEQAKHQSAFERFDQRIREIEADQAMLDKRIKETRDNIGEHMRGLTKLQAEIEQLPRQEAQAIADHVSAKTLVAMNDQLKGLSSSIDRGPIEAVLQRNRELTAEAKVVTTLAGTDVSRQDAEYEDAGGQATSRQRMEAMLAARKAERGARTGGTTEAPRTEDRPKI